jgi:23S rRNA (cytidine1920-2'-O)/16S rRNA (cytidine1409-2'-O)-methyltransferase
MVKPQFEVGKDRVGAGGVVRDPTLRAEAVLRVAGQAAEHGLRTRGVAASPLPGPSGNVEYFLWLCRDIGPDGRCASAWDDGAGLAQLVERAVQEGPQ